MFRRQSNALGSPNLTNVMHRKYRTGCDARDGAMQDPPEIPYLMRWRLEETMDQDKMNVDKVRAKVLGQVKAYIQIE